MNKYDVLAWFYPNKCLICGKGISGKECVCTACMPEKTVLRTFYIKSKGKRYFFHCESFYFYRNYYKYCIKRYKFKGKKSYCRKFVCLGKNLLNINQLQNYDCICYVPMTLKDIKERGYNQSELIAKDLSKITGLKVCPTLSKIKENKKQITLKRKDRKSNVIGVYKCVQDIKGQNILLVDDIITTGATLSQCAKILYDAGALSVKGICVANKEYEKII